MVAVDVVTLIVAAMASWMAMQVERIAMQTVVPIQTLRDMTKTLNDKSTEKITPEQADALLGDHAHSSPEVRFNSISIQFQFNFNSISIQF